MESSEQRGVQSGGVTARIRYEKKTYVGIEIEKWRKI